MGHFTWQHIQFENGSNPYICTTEKAFKFMQKRYNLVKLRDGFWLAKKSLRELLAEVDKIEDDEEFMRAEFEVVSEYCHSKKCVLSAADEKIIKLRGLGQWLDNWKHEQEV